jgi:hypothetical protein
MHGLYELLAALIWCIDMRVALNGVLIEIRQEWIWYIMYNQGAHLPFAFASRLLVGLPSLGLQFFHLLRILLLDPLNRLVAVVFHHTLFLEVFDLESRNSS